MFAAMRALAVSSFALLLLACDGTTSSQSDASLLSDAATASTDLAPSSLRSSPMGATVTAGGVLFRVWAPDAIKVSVVGDWNNNDASRDPLAALGDETWAGLIASAQTGQKYQYAITPTTGTHVLRSDPRARQVTSVQGSSVIVDSSAYRWTTNHFVAAPASAQVIYELHVGTFNVPAGSAPPSTFAKVSDKMAYLAALGVTHIELMPPAEFPESHSWGYNPALPFAVSTVYGSPDDLRALVDAAHAQGIGVIVDVVHNHWGPDLPTLWCFDGDCLGNKKGGVYFYTDARMSTPWGPRPDYGRSAVRAFIRDNALLWLTEYRGDGLRWDSTINIRTDGQGNDIADGLTTLRLSNDAAHAIRPVLEIAEDFAGDDAITTPTQSGGAGFDSQWDGDFFHPLDDALTQASDAARSMTAVAGAITHSFQGPASTRIIYTESHDVVANGGARIPAEISPKNPSSLLARKLSTVGAAVVMTAPGTPMIFMGQEFLEDGSFADTNPLHWDKATTYAGILQLYTDLIHLRRNLAGTTAGLTGDHVNVFHVNDGAKVLAFHRYAKGGPGDDVVVVTSFTATPFANYNIGLPRAGLWKVRFNGDSTRYSSDFGNTANADVPSEATPQDGFAQRGTVHLGAYQTLILSQ